MKEVNVRMFLMGKGEVSALLRGESLSVNVPASDEPQLLMLGVIAGVAHRINASRNGHGYYNPDTEADPQPPRKKRRGRKHFHCSTCKKKFRKWQRLYQHKIDEHNYKGANQYAKKKE